MPKVFEFPELMSFEESKKLLGDWPMTMHIRHWLHPEEDTIVYKKTGSLDEQPIMGELRKAYLLVRNMTKLKDAYFP